MLSIINIIYCSCNPLSMLSMTHVIHYPCYLLPMLSIIYVIYYSCYPLSMLSFTHVIHYPCYLLPMLSIVHFSGNPLASPTGSLPWPSRCPDGFSQHLASVVMVGNSQVKINRTKLVGEELGRRIPYICKTHTINYFEK